MVFVDHHWYLVVMQDPFCIIRQPFVNKSHVVTEHCWVKSYSCNIQKATRCLKELEVPHFHHELVYEAVVMVIKSMHKKTDEAMCKLLQALFRSFIIILERWVLRCRQAGIKNDDIVKKIPSHGRKRFVSEGDGGLIKDSSYWWFENEG